MSAEAINPDSPLPRWAQIANILRQRIQKEGPYLKGLSDAALTLEFGVSPLTVRQAVQDLVSAGLVVRHRGKGTFVVPAPLSGSLDNLEAFMREWQVQGHDVRVEILERSVIAASLPIAAGLGIRPGQPVGYLKRLRYTDDSPVVVDYRYIPADLNTQLDDEDLKHEAIWQILERKFSILSRRSHTTIKATIATEEEMKLLGLTRGSPILSRAFQLIGENERVLLSGDSSYHPERFIYSTVIRKESP